MRLKAEIIIAAELKHAQSLGLFATILHKGDVSAGQIYLVINKDNCEFILIGPPYGTSFNENGEKLWDYPLGEAPISQAELNQYFDKIKKFDADIYILEIEDKSLIYRPSGVFPINEGEDSANAKRDAERAFKN